MVQTNRNLPSQSIRRSYDVNTKALYIPGDDSRKVRDVSPTKLTTEFERCAIKDVNSTGRSASNTYNDAQKAKRETPVHKGKLFQRHLEATKTIQSKSENGNRDKKIKKSPKIKVTVPSEQTSKQLPKSVKTSTPLTSPRPTPSPSPIMFNGRPKSSGVETLSKPFDFNNRRSSVASSNPSIKKISSFATAGRQVSSILKFKKSFGISLKNSIPEDVIEVGDEIRELPKSPRFASYLSPEAQFAVMKGYEDVLHREISIKLPMYKPHLKRTKTPNNKIEMKRLDRAGFRRSRDDDLDSVSSIYSDDITADYFETRRASMPATTNFYGFSAPMLKDRPRAHSSPASFVPREKRLVLTYRFESAMDILDTLRFQSGSSTISPRVTDNPRKILPVKDFNNWTCVWHNEFETEGANNSSVKAWRT